MMDDKTLQTLEYDKILERLANYAAFPASAELARALRPGSDLDEARRRLAQTGEAVRLLATHPDLTIGGARDVRAPVDLARRNGVLDPGDLLDIKYTLIAARNLARTFERLETAYPTLFAIIARMTIPTGIIEATSRAISERGDILDSASPKLAQIRHDLRIAHDRLMTRLQRIVADPKNGPYLQEAIITQRDHRYVIPLRAEFKGRIRSVIHDQSSSGATLFVEPIAVVELNNELRELELAQRDEERRILAELSALVGDNAEAILNTVIVVAELDMALACGRFAEDMRATEPVLHSIRTKPYAQPVEGKAHPGSLIRLYQARHPLLDPQKVVPIDFDLDPQNYAVIITGPNTGGKTVTLKTVGLLALMAQSGLHIPAHSGSEISLFEDIYADIGDEQSIEQSLSTFSGHVTNIIRILRRANRRSLVILDELGAGTDPQEGAALARALLTHLLQRGITTLVTTHHPELKAFAHATPGAVNASVEFDLKTLQPTFRLTIGLPGRSNALAIAKRLGLPPEIITDARQDLNPEDVRVDTLLDEIHRQRDLALRARSSADRMRTEAEKLRNELMDRLEKIEDERRKVMEAARLQSENELEALREEIKEMRKTLARARQPVESLQNLEADVQALQETVEKPLVRQQPEYGPALKQLEEERRKVIRLGDKVRVQSLGAQGVVISLSEEEAEVSIGMLRVRARLADLERAGGGEAAKPAAKPGGINALSKPPAEKKVAESNLPPSPGMELDLRGQRAEDALDALDRYLDAAFLASLPFVRIIHGKGTGRLREVIRQALHSHPHVRSYESGGEKEGGDGVTVAKLG